MIAKSLVRRVAAAMLAFVIASQNAAYAAGTGGCDSFEWSLATELAWMTSADAVELASGATLPAPPQKAIAVKLEPSAALNLPVAPSGKSKADAAETFGGIVSFDGAPKAGLYQVTLSDPGWIDVVQNGAASPAVAHTGKSDCEGIRKSVRFDIGAGPFSVQLSGAPSRSIRFSVSPAQ